MTHNTFLELNSLCSEFALSHVEPVETRFFIEIRAHFGRLSTALRQAPCPKVVCFEQILNNKLSLLPVPNTVSRVCLKHLHVIAPVPVEVGKSIKSAVC